MFNDSKYTNLNNLRVFVENSMKREKEYEILARAGEGTYYATKAGGAWPREVYLIKRANIVRVAGD